MISNIGYCFECALISHVGHCFECALISQVGHCFESPLICQVRTILVRQYGKYGEDRCIYSGLRIQGFVVQIINPFSPDISHHWHVLNDQLAHPASAVLVVHQPKLGYCFFQTIDNSHCDKSQSSSTTWLRTNTAHVGR